eukprot:COSAG05_NODE_6091_length_1023_cov_1.048701_2_plen_93_part_00
MSAAEGAKCGAGAATTSGTCDELPMNREPRGLIAAWLTRAPGRSLRRQEERAGVEKKPRVRKANKIIETQIVEHTLFSNPSERDLFPREFAR